MSELTPKKINRIKRISGKVIRSNSKFFGMCLYMSAILANEINDKTSLKAKVVVGSLEVRGHKLFSYSPISQILENSFNVNKSINLSWDGHAWVEVEGYIIDPSIIFSISIKSTRYITDAILKAESQDYGFIFNTYANLLTKGVNYEKRDYLSPHSNSILLKDSKLIL